MRIYLNNEQRRVHLLDEMRGIWLFLMILYHAAYDLVYLFNIPIPGFHGPVFRVVQLCIAGGFILLSGIVTRYSRSSIRRGALVLGCGMVLTLFTWLVMPSQIILFGVLHFLGVAMILFGLLRPLLDRVNPLVGLLFCVLLFAFTWNVQGGYLGIQNIFTLPLPQALYNIRFLFPLGFPGPGFSSSDYVPLLPWLFFFLGGSFLGVYFREGHMPGFFYDEHSPRLGWIGRHTIWIYLVHQPIIYGVIWGILWIVQFIKGYF